MKKVKFTVLSAIAVTMIGTAGFAGEDGDECIPDCEPPADTAGNPSNGKPVGNSPWDGITGNSANNSGGSGAPIAATMNGQRSDTPYAQPGGKGNGPSSANK